MRLVFISVAAFSIMSCGSDNPKEGANDDAAAPAGFIEATTESESVALDSSNINPAELTGARVYRPKPDPSMQYLVEKDQVLDTRTGEIFWLRTPHGDSMAEYGLMGGDLEVTVNGGYYRHLYTDDGRKWSIVYDIVSTKRWEPGAPDYAPNELDVSRLATFIRAKHDAMSKGADIEVIVVDSRRSRQS